jgi:hypothetical protein
VELSEIAQLLSGESPDSVQQLQVTGRDTGVHTVALFAVLGSVNGDVLELAGTGILIAIEESHYVLTAAHVWEKRLKNANKLGISLREGVDHSCLIEIDAIVPSGPPQPASWNEWGLDIIFLRIPPVRVGEIEAFRVFYREVAEGQSQVPMAHVEIRFLIGTPGALGSFSQTHADLQIVSFGVNGPVHQVHNGIDYLDVHVQMPHPSTADSFGGVSGGGLWRVRVYNDPNSDGIASDATLEGMAFYEIGVQEGNGTIRCHSLESIHSAMPIS